jgi:hypothetical protein
MSNQVSTTNERYITIKNTDIIYTVSIRSALRSELVMKAEIERGVLELEINQGEEQ